MEYVYFHELQQIFVFSCSPANNTIRTISKYDFDLSLEKLPNIVTCIIFGYMFNRSVDKLQNSVTSITFGFLFNKSVDNLPNSVTSIKFGMCFNKTLKHLSKFVKTIFFLIPGYMNIFIIILGYV